VVGVVIDAEQIDRVFVAIAQFEVEDVPPANGGAVVQ